MRFVHVRDQDLLLLDHGALSAPRRVLVEGHLRWCAPCRQRRRQFAQASQALAGAIRDPSDPPWRPPPARPGPLTTVLITLALVLALGVTLVLRTSHGHHAPPVRAYSGGCRPDLPNDRCR